MEKISRAELMERNSRLGRCGFVYFMSDGELVKIGWSVSPEHRRKDIRHERKKEITLIAWFRAVRSDESCLHERHRHLRVEGEWFRPSAEIEETISILRATHTAGRSVQDTLIEHHNAKNRIRHPSEVMAEVSRKILAERARRKTERLQGI